MFTLLIRTQANAGESADGDASTTEKGSPEKKASGSEKEIFDKKLSGGEKEAPGKKAAGVEKDASEKKASGGEKEVSEGEDKGLKTAQDNAALEALLQRLPKSGSRDLVDQIAVSIGDRSVYLKAAVSCPILGGPVVGLSRMQTIARSGPQNFVDPLLSLSWWGCSVHGLGNRQERNAKE
jgi:hypothetical protein